MGNFQSLADVRAIEAEMPFAARDLPKTAITYQLFSGPAS